MPKPAGPSPRTLRTLFRAAALVEALTWAGLLVGMAFKYLISGDETGVHVFGPLHGGAFIAYVVMSLVAARAFGWRVRTTLLALAASIPPLATWAFEAWADRTGRLSRVGVGR
jgi:integral membrane protein